MKFILAIAKTPESSQRKYIPEAVARQRWEQGQALFSTWTEIWRSNPQIARNAGTRVQELMMPLAEVQRRHASDLA